MKSIKTVSISIYVCYKNAIIPDNVAKNLADTKQAKQQSEQYSAVINQAYQTLSAPDSRAGYLLGMADQAQNLEHSIADLDFFRRCDGNAYGFR
ncbi:hypothetical protein [Psychrobacter sp. KH172YL61]|uniref:hypothetical protein n=1 Tax=Psychrobacter sp. KH172YL61 TaxID=2517899 RepID=UPI001F07E5E0|nr:hypothetical protein [Psychrobacter sp. KH172YL61]